MSIDRAGDPQASRHGVGLAIGWGKMFAETWISYPFQGLIILLLIAANGFFVATEFAFVKIRASQLKSMRRPGKKDWRLSFAIRVTTHLDRYLSATQLGITLTSLGLGWVGEPVVADWVEGPLARWGVGSAATVASISYALAFAGITFVDIVLGELVPKYFAIRRPRPVVFWMSGPLILFYTVAYPFIWLLNRTANRLLMWIGIPPTKEFDHGFNQEELQYVLMNSHHVHPSDELVNKIMLKAIRLKETTAEQVMLPRQQVVVLWRDKPLQENLAVAQRSGYSRLPLCGDTQDQVLGVIHVKELLWQYQVLGTQTNLVAIVRPILTFMAKTRLPAMLELFRRSRNHLAVVLDRDEKLLGLVSFEDVLEELVGDIRDEFDIEKGPIFERSPDAVLVDTDLPLRDLAMETGWPTAHADHRDGGAMGDAPLAPRASGRSAARYRWRLSAHRYRGRPAAHPPPAGGATPGAHPGRCRRGRGSCSVRGQFERDRKEISPHESSPTYRDRDHRQILAYLAFDNGEAWNTPSATSSLSQRDDVFVCPVHARPSYVLQTQTLFSFKELWIEKEVKTEFGLVWFYRQNWGGSYLLCFTLNGKLFKDSKEPLFFRHCSHAGDEFRRARTRQAFLRDDFT